MFLGRDWAQWQRTKTVGQIQALNMVSVSCWATSLSLHVDCPF